MDKNDHKTSDKTRALLIRLSIGSALLLSIIGLSLWDKSLSGDNSLDSRHLILPILIYLLAALALNEFQKMLAKSRGMFPFRTISQVFLFILFLGEIVIHDYANGNPKASSAFYLLFIVFVPLLLLLVQAITRRPKGLDNISINLFAILYIGVPSLCVLKFMYIDGVGSWGFLYLILVAKSADIMGYLVGRKWGRHKIVPSISPKKSWEGSIAGLLGSLATAVLLPYLFNMESMFALSWGDSCWPGLAIYFGLFVGIGSQLGDWAESLLKRECAIKDSGSMLPEFGGILDLIDCLLVAGPLAYVICLINAMSNIS